MTRLSLRNSCKQKMDDYKKALTAGKKPMYPTRIYHRCNLCSRRHGYMRFFGICRICFRELAVRGEIPGLKKSSW